MKMFGISLFVVALSLLSASSGVTHPAVYSSSTYFADGVVPPPPPSCTKGCSISSMPYFADGVVPPPSTASTKPSSALLAC